MQRNLTGLTTGFVFAYTRTYAFFRETTLSAFAMNTNADGSLFPNGMVVFFFSVQYLFSRHSHRCADTSNPSDEHNNIFEKYDILVTWEIPFKSFYGTTTFADTRIVRL